MFDKLRSASRLLLVQELKPAKATVFSQPASPTWGLRFTTRQAANGCCSWRVLSPWPTAWKPRASTVAAPRSSRAWQDSLRPGKLVGPVETVTTSLVEAHRLNSPYIIANKAIQETFIERSGYAKGQPIDWSRIAKAVSITIPIRCCMASSWPTWKMAGCVSRERSRVSSRPRRERRHRAGQEQSSRSDWQAPRLWLRQRRLQQRSVCPDGIHRRLHPRLFQSRCRIDPRLSSGRRGHQPANRSWALQSSEVLEFWVAPADGVRFRDERRPRLHHAGRLHRPRRGGTACGSEEAHLRVR